MHARAAVQLRDLTTIRLGGPCRSLVRADDESALIDVVRRCDEADEPLLIVGGGSNLVVADAGIDGTVISIHTSGVEVTPQGDAVLVRVAAGESWENLVQRSMDEGWSGIEAMSGIPGLVGATPIQNVGAYGQEVAQTVVDLRCYDRTAGDVVQLAADQCSFGYRTSRFKRDNRFVVLSVTFRLEISQLSSPLAYAELARSLGSQLGRRVPTTAVRAVVLGLRRSKGMVIDESDLDTRSVGSFFTNPVVSPNVSDLLPPDAPRFTQSDGRVKLSAAWLIESAGFECGQGHGDARISSKHTLALTNRGSATTEQILQLAREIRDGVRRRFSIELVVEPHLVACSL